ncbi:MAG: T9SS type A sorting domain-containing protein [Ignavibacterium sp.]|jgi:DNA/RNA endonuclease YhcR with UshA esterase domain|nr:T9SS type A sorting domain-containing protein [Ignavibacterium sp.]
MKKRFKNLISMFGMLTLLLFVFNTTGLSQSYPLVTLYDINYIADSTLYPNFPFSPLAGDTVRVRGVAMVRTVVGSDEPGVGDRRPVIWAGPRWSCYIQDKDNPEWRGLVVLQEDTSSANAQQTLFDLADTATVYEFTGVVKPYFQTTQLLLITSPVPIPIEEIEVLPERPAPTQITIEDLYTGTSGNYSMRKYMNTYVELVADANHNLITSDRVTGTGSTSGNFKINDGQGRYIIVYAQSTYFKMNSDGIRPDYESPVNGTYLSYIRGILTMRSNANIGVDYWLVPLYPEDLGDPLILPPSVTNVTRNLVLVAPNQSVDVSCIAKGVQADLQSVKIFYRVNNGTLDSVDMAATSGDTLFTGTIPGVSADSAFVDFYIRATDLNGTSMTNPFNPNTSRYFYFVLNRPLTIREVQYSPFGNGLSGYYNYPVTVSGIVTADTVGRFTSTGFGAPSSANRIIIQDGTGTWSGIWLNAANTTKDVFGLKMGDFVTVTGVVKEDYDVTRLDNISVLDINSNNNPLPEATVVTTGSIGTLPSNNVAAEQWESVLIKFENVSITDVNADGNPGPDPGSGSSRNFGEIVINDGTGNVRCELQDGNHKYHNDWNANLGNNPNFVSVDSGATLTSLTGYLYFSHSYYKLVPRITDDFNNYTVVSVDDQSNLIPGSFTVNQNYPNPFNPSTVISYSIPNEAFVTVKVYNVLGQEVATLLNDIQSAGVHKINFNASKLSSGIYFYSVKADNHSDVKKMILMK